MLPDTDLSLVRAVCHTHRPLTFIKYNAEGDLLVTCAKDQTPNLWYADDGERIGTYVGHNGAVFTCDISGALPRLVAGLLVGLSLACGGGGAWR